eukprot:CAMPEP_0116141164 /NCGR_PEP_ID=MMETSP0329-20121206/14235_1 /TAXON_ID=697910 /ORGANISM="Pseudo-nitzschia arenysensis, Strain B593" /LENGTH=398 /DNA_ID=CAMNT_0003636327 /DNA_START=54 /DNA_END=1250 /DNA_ORIENTATION=+
MYRSTQQSAIKAICLSCIVYNVCEAFTSTSGPTALHHGISRNSQPFNSIETDKISTALPSSFYDDFEDFEFSKGGDNGNDDDDDDDDEYAEMDERSIAEFKSKMSNMFDDETTTNSGGDGSGKVLGTVDELINFARQTESAESTESTTETLSLDWAKPTTEIRPGTVLVANPRKFCAEGDYGAESEPSGGGKDFFASALGKTRHLGADRQADLLPVVIVVSVDAGQIQGVLLNRRTGYLLGDLEQPSEDGTSDEEMAPILEKFCIQPLWFGGIDSISVGLDMLHLCPTVNGATQITEDGMFWGGDPTQAQDAMEDPSLDRIYSGFDFKFFVQSTIWSNAGTIQSEIDEQVWFPASVSQNILFKSRDRMGTKKAKPLWTEIMDLMGDEYAEITKNFYIE